MVYATDAWEIRAYLTYFGIHKLRMKKQDRIESSIQKVVETMMDRVMKKVLVTDPFIKEDHHAKKPLYAALVPDEIFKGSHFERRFVTPFGKLWENLAEVVGRESHGTCQTSYPITGTIPKERLRRIQEVLNKLEHGGSGKKRVRPNWENELSYILKGGGTPTPVTVLCDLYVCNLATGKAYAFELKGPLPNSDQTKVSKEKIFKLLAMSEAPVEMAFYALPYNPYRERKHYDWSFPMRWFDMKHDPSVLIGVEFWDFIGGVGTYAKFIEQINTLGKEYRLRIYREFLRIEPPSGSDDYLLR